MHNDPTYGAQHDQHVWAYASHLIDEWHMIKWIEAQSQDVNEWFDPTENYNREH